MRRRTIATVAALAMAASSVSVLGGVAGAQQADNLSLVPLDQPVRVLDTRDEGGAPLQAGTALAVPMEDELPAGAVAAVINVTAVDTEGPGHLRVWPCTGQDPEEVPLVSSLNFTTGQTVANQVTVRLGANSDVCFFSTADTHLVVDANAYYADDADEHGWVQTTPTRLYDSRDNGGAKREAGVTSSVIVVREDLTENAGVVTLNVTVTEPDTLGHLRVWPCTGAEGEPPPLVSSLNFVAGQTVPNAVTVRPGAADMVCFWSTATTHLVVDLTASYEAAAGDRFAAIDPVRVLDTREAEEPAEPEKLEAGSVLTLDVSGAAPGGTAVVLNVTVTEPEALGHLRVFPCPGNGNDDPPLVSTLNFVEGETRANAATVAVGANNSVCFWSTATTHLVVDHSGTFTPVNNG